MQRIFILVNLLVNILDLKNNYLQAFASPPQPIELRNPGKLLQFFY